MFTLNICVSGMLVERSLEIRDAPCHVNKCPQVSTLGLMPRLPLPLPPKRLPVLNNYQLKSVGNLSQEPWTKDWFHLRDIPKIIKTQLKRRPHESILAKYQGLVPVENRIKQWNIIPGDLIRIRGQGEVIQEVFGVDKFKNIVYLKNKEVRNVAFKYKCISFGSKDTCVSRVPRPMMIFRLCITQNVNYTLATMSIRLRQEKQSPSSNSTSFHHKRSSSLTICSPESLLWTYVVQLLNGHHA